MYLHETPSLQSGGHVRYKKQKENMKTHKYT